MKPVAHCRQGKLLGIEENRVFAFYNVPYGTNRGRFKELGEARSWIETRDATKPGPVFPQLESRLASVMGKTVGKVQQSEDAFCLNIWTKDIKKKAPVLIWIHGGAFVTGGASLPWYNGSQLAYRGDIVVVSVNYRLGALGNLYLPGVTTENLAIKDLIAAFSWVQDNIASFGGDPEQIAVAGQSAGAWYVVALMAVKKMGAMIKRAALFSFPGLHQPLKPREANELTGYFLEALHLSGEGKKNLAEVPVNSILAAQAQVSSIIKKLTQRNVAFLPTVDGTLVNDDIIAGAISEYGGRNSVLAGVTAEETASFVHQLDMVFMPLLPLAKLAKALYPYQTKEVLRYYNKKHGKDKPYHQLISLGSDATFKFPTYRLLKGLNERGTRTYAYRFDYTSKMEKLLSCHCFDLPFIFGNFDQWQDAPMLSGANSQEIERLSHILQSYFIGFIRAGDPQSPGLLTWPCYSQTQEKIMVFDKETAVTPVDLPVSLDSILQFSL